MNYAKKKRSFYLLCFAMPIHLQENLHCDVSKQKNKNRFERKNTFMEVTKRRPKNGRQKKEEKEMKYVQENEEKRKESSVSNIFCV